MSQNSSDNWQPKTQTFDQWLRYGVPPRFIDLRRQDAVDAEREARAPKEPEQP